MYYVHLRQQLDNKRLPNNQRTNGAEEVRVTLPKRRSGRGPLAAENATRIATAAPHNASLVNKAWLAFS
jgi:hypothetical protein